MKNTEGEIKFSEYGRELLLAVHRGLYELVVRSGFDWWDTGAQIEGDKTHAQYNRSLHGKAQTLYAKFKASEDSVEEAITVTMGHDEKWNAVVIVASTKTDPKQVNLSGRATHDAQTIEMEVNQCFKAIKAD